ncbi:MAG: hypothetical protein ACLUD2_17945 [Clostridium sp.]
MISNATFPSYFLKDSTPSSAPRQAGYSGLSAHCQEALSVTDRFVGEEPFSQVTGIYNQVMAEELASTGLNCHIIPRKADEDGAISASEVRLPDQGRQL